MLKIVKKPQPISSLATISLRLQNGKKCLFPFFGDVINTEDRQMLTTGQGPTATPLGSENITDGLVCRSWESLGTGGDGIGLLKLKLKKHLLSLVIAQEALRRKKEHLSAVCFQIKECVEVELSSSGEKQSPSFVW